MINNGKQSPAIYHFRVALIATCAALSLSLTACGKSGSEDNASSQAKTEPAQSSEAAPEEKAMTETPAETPMPQTSEEAPMAEHMGSAMDAGTEQQTAAQATPEREPLSGREVYTSFCVICHRAGMNGAPKYGDKIAWGKRVSQGKETLYSAAINGLRAMPPKGGIAGLSDQEVKDGVDFMVNGSGGWGGAE